MTPFVPKSWGNFSTGGTPLNAAGLNDLEARIAASVNVASVTTGIYAYDYGVRADGTTPSAVFLQDALDAARDANAGVVWLPGGASIRMQSPVNVWDRVRLVGTGKRTTELVATPGFPTSTAMITLGDGLGNFCFDTRLENMSVTMSGIAGSRCVFSNGCNEGSGLQNVGLFGFVDTGGYFVSGNQNFRLSELEIYGFTGSLYGLQLSDGPNVHVDQATIFTNTTDGIGIYALGSEGMTLHGIHCEQTKYGIKVLAGPIDIYGCTGHASVGTFIWLLSGTNSCTLRSIASANTPITLQDDCRGITILNGNITSYSQAEANVGRPQVFITYSASMTPIAIDAEIQRINVTNGTAMTINSPTSPTSGQRLTLDIINSSGGAMGVITWNSAFKLAGAFVNPASGKRRTISFYYDSVYWIETNRAAADI